MLIGEVARRSGISARSLRHYDAIGLLCPSERTSGGYRSYTPADCARLLQIEGLRALGLTLAQVSAALDDPGFSATALIDRLRVRATRRIEAELALRDRLELIAHTEPQDWQEVLHTTGLLSSLNSPDPAVRQQTALAARTGTARTGTARTGTAQTGPAHPDALLPALLAAALTEETLNPAATLAWAVAQAGDAALPGLRVALTHPDAETRLRALAILAKLTSPAAMALRAELWRHPDPKLALHGEITRAEAGEAAAIPALVAGIGEGRRDTECAAALAALAALATPPATADAVVAHIRRGLVSGDTASRVRLTEALADIPGDPATALLRELSAAAEPGVALTARYLLGRRPK